MSDPKPRELEGVARAVGRPRGREGGRNHTPESRARLIRQQRERAQVRAWRAAPEAIAWLRGVLAGTEEYSEGKYKAASLILSRTMPTLSAQAVESHSTSVTVSADTLAEGLHARLKAVGMLPVARQ